MTDRERLSSRMGFILLSAGCAIGCGNVWKFPWVVGQYGGGSFVLVYVLFLILLGLPVLIMEFALGRASQASPVGMYQKLQRPGQMWHIHGYFSLFGNICLMSFYTTVAGWFVYYFCKFAAGTTADLGFMRMISDPGINLFFMALIVAVGFLILSFDLTGGLERVTKYMMVSLLLLIILLAANSLLLPGAAEGLKFYLMPDFGMINGQVIVAAMSQAFFTLSLGIGGMAVFGSYIGKERTLLGESSGILVLDTFVAVTAGLIIFPACTTYGLTVGSGPSLLFDTMATVFNHMDGGRLWGSFFFLFMIFAAFSTVLAVFENILSCVREMTGWGRPKSCIVCGIVIFLLSCTTALGFSTFSGFEPFGPGTSWMDLWDFLLSTNLLPLGTLVIAMFCCSERYGWGWKKLKEEANAGKGPKIHDWMKPLFAYAIPIIIGALYIYCLVTFK